MHIVIYIGLSLLGLVIGFILGFMAGYDWKEKNPLKEVKSIWKKDEPSKDEVQFFDPVPTSEKFDSSNNISEFIDKLK